MTQQTAKKYEARLLKPLKEQRKQAAGHERTNYEAESLKSSDNILIRLRVKQSEQARLVRGFREDVKGTIAKTDR